MIEMKQRADLAEAKIWMQGSVDVAAAANRCNQPLHICTTGQNTSKIACTTPKVANAARVHTVGA